MRRPVVALALFVVLLGTGCGHSRGSVTSISRARLPQLVLHPADVGSRLTRFDAGKQVSADAHSGPRFDPARFGRIDGWKARYRGPAGELGAGPLVVESRADLFGGVDGAKRDLQAYGEELRGLGKASGGSLRELHAPALGDDAVAVSLRQGRLLYVTVAWRERNVTASVSASGLAGKFGPRDTFALARKQAARINDAAS
jgi:hypothetical protein